MKTKIWQDPVVAEVRKIKERLAAKFNFDVQAMLRDQMSREQRHGSRLVSLELKHGLKRTKST